VDNFVDALLGMELEETYSCEETDMEPQVRGLKSMYCRIDRLLIDSFGAVVT
jgi:hypothetical protein